MARIHGRRGRVYAGVASGGTAEPIPFLTSWTIDFTVDKVDVTCLGDQNKTYVSGLPDASGTVAGFYDTETAQFYTASQDGLARKFYLYPDTADTAEYFFGTGLFDFAINGAVADGVAVTGSWAAASAISKVAS
jgi:hypothetical protein